MRQRLPSMASAPSKRHGSMETMEAPWARTPPSQEVDAVSLAPSKTRLLMWTCALAEADTATNNSDRGQKIGSSVWGQNITRGGGERGGSAGRQRSRNQTGATIHPAGRGSLNGSAIGDEGLDTIRGVDTRDLPGRAVGFEE